MIAHMVGYPTGKCHVGHPRASDIRGCVMADQVIFDVGSLVDKMSVYDMKGRW